MFEVLQPSKITVRSMPLGDFLELVAQGQLQIPRFQREFVWPISKTLALLDSMFKEFPIGTFFFWQAPADQAITFRELEDLHIPAPDPHQPVSYILDGQQRLTSLFAAGHSLSIGTKDYGNICLDLEAAQAYESSTDEFDKAIFVSRRSPDNKRYVRFHDVLMGNLSVYDRLSVEGKAIFQAARQRFSTYPFSVVWVRDQPLGEVVEIFQRINQGGKRLSSYDLVCANLWSESFNFRRKVATLNKQFVDKGFGHIDENIVPQAITLILTGKSSQSGQLRLKSETVEAIWPNVSKALMRAIDFLRNNVGVKRAEFLPYGGILALLTMFFYKLNGKAPTAEHRTTLWRWFWWTSASERYSYASREKINSDAEYLENVLSGEPVDRSWQVSVKAESLLHVSMKSKTSALRNTFLCLLALQGPRNFKDGSPVNLSLDFFSTLARAERHHVFPVNFLKQQHIAANQVHLLPNFIFIPGELNREISDKSPSEYMTEYQSGNTNFDADIKTHLIPINAKSAIWADEYEEFLKQRAALLAERLNQIVEVGPTFASTSPGLIADDAASQWVESVELQLRDLIDGRLSAVGGNMYWNKTVPQKIQNKVVNKIGQHVTAHPYVNPATYASGRKKLDFCDIGDYIGIIKANWSQFSDVFGNQDIALRHFDDFRRFRNLVAHNNKDELTDVLRKNAEAAIIWLQRIFDAYVVDEPE